VTATHITLLVDEFRHMVAAVEGPHRFPALEQVFSRGQSCSVNAPSPNHLRFALFGIEAAGELPVAALTHVNDRKTPPDGDYFWLRSDPVTMWADMARVFMTSHGFADLDAHERNGIEDCIRGVLQDEGINVHGGHPERWCIALDEPLEFDFTPLDQAVGMDVSEALPDHPEARFWRRILNEVQVALHHCPVNIRRREQGRQEINSVWFWGGGFMPEVATHNPVDTVYSNNPVSRGLAIINDCRLKSQKKAVREDFSRDGRAVLIDWAPSSQFAVEELERLEALVGRLLEQVDHRNIILRLLDGKGEGRSYDHRARRRFWRRKKPLIKPADSAGT
jgi:hypothetical protein